MGTCICDVSRNYAPLKEIRVRIRCEHRKVQTFSRSLDPIIVNVRIEQVPRREPTRSVYDVKGVYPLNVDRVQLIHTTVGKRLSYKMKHRDRVKSLRVL